MFKSPFKLRGGKLPPARFSIRVLKKQIYGRGCRTFARNNSRLQKSKRTYCAFVDFSKAFDSVDREILFKKLQLLGIPYKFCKLLHNVWSRMKSYMRSGLRFSSPFTPNIGVPQGDVIAAILFALFIADLPESLLPVGPEIEINLATCMIAYILFADDLALLADSPENLQKQLIALQNYCELNNLKVNIIKTKVMIFHRGRLPNLDINFTFRFNNIPIERVKSFTTALSFPCIRVPAAHERFR